MTTIAHPAEIQTNSPASPGNLRKRAAGVLARPNLKLFSLGALGLCLVAALLFDHQCTSGRVTTWLDTSVDRPGLDALLEDARVHPCAELLFEIGLRYEQLKNYRKAMDYLRMANEADSVSER